MAIRVMSKGESTFRRFLWILKAIRFSLTGKGLLFTAEIPSEPRTAPSAFIFPAPHLF